ncbi:hypothetical protein GCM10025770_13140 [Viridibacterium curvum]|uniref:Uncharacterized protein n=1 Tax=Viridibacterium curvum TaxID=1101404 RepID=A0ABP9QJ24_9RHOO
MERAKLSRDARVVSNVLRSRQNLWMHLWLWNAARETLALAFVVEQLWFMPSAAGLARASPRGWLYGTSAKRDAVRVYGPHAGGV